MRLPGQDAHHIAPGELILLKIDTHGTRTAINHADMKDIVSKTLQSWSARSVTVAQQDEPEVKDA